MGTLMEIKDLTKRYGHKTVLDNISLSLESGKIVGLLGPNGCGKTTLMKVLTGLIKDYTGTVLIDGQEPGVYTKSIISYLPDKEYFSGNKRPSDMFDLFEEFYTDFDRKKAENMLVDFDLDPMQKMKTMSLGMQEKLQIALVMARNAKVYLLDEPLGGIDPLSRDKILNTILRNYSENALVIISTHLIHDVETIFDSVLMIRRGNLIVNKQVDEIRAESGKSIEEFFKEVF
ncbi:MAG: transporter related [Clostridiales bacterium]|jgi:ABC-2 type transport system ATP-binding protein|nr:transporter related [Clostridiales bacterium]